ncbi:MAG TPA: TetR/AcrR family transcriptional regulator [Candidatus Wallbacteria bacterium]|nr:TetR/AcrR family transcriptional regulator [Candidatus Wallbacteria bacterium]
MKKINETSCKREAILDSALELIAEKGFHGASTDLIAKKANAGVGSIYRYFASKDILITELYKELLSNIKRDMLIGYKNDGPIKEKFIHLCGALLQFFISSPIEFKFLEQYSNSPYGISCRREQVFGEDSDLLKMFRDGQKAGLIKKLPPSVLLALIFGPIITMARDHIQGIAEMNDKKILKNAVEACWDAIASH